MKSARESRPCADARLADRLLGRQHGEALGEHRRAERLDVDEVDRAGDRRAQALGGEAADRVDAGAAGRQRPVVVLALARAR